KAGQDTTDEAYKETPPARPPLLRQAGERVQVDDELREVAAMPARPARAAMAAVIEGRDSEPARGQVRDEVAVAADVLRIAVGEEHDAARGAGRRRRALPVDGDAAGPGEGALGCQRACPGCPARRGLTWLHNL